MLITGHEQKQSFADVAIRMLSIASFQSAETILAEMEREEMAIEFSTYENQNEPIIYN